MIPCSNCRIGQMRKTHITYFTWLGEQMITVPDFPAWICDMCGKREYDLQALDNLALMLCPPPKASRVSKFQNPSNKSIQAPLGKRA
jgi:YgiT-type zinc finger domain-containing protein